VANLANAKKAIRVQARKSEINKKIRVKAKRLLKEANQAVENKDKKTAVSKLQETKKTLDKASKRFIHPKKVSRLKSRLEKKVNSLS